MAPGVERRESGDASVGRFPGLLLGGPVAEPVLWSLVWAAGIAVVFYPLAMRAYRAKT